MLLSLNHKITHQTFKKGLIQTNQKRFTEGKKVVGKVFKTFFKERFVLKEKLCLALLDTGYTPLTVYSFLVLGGQKNNNNNYKLVVLRHDIDRKFGNALRMAEWV